MTYKNVLRDDCKLTSHLHTLYYRNYKHLEIPKSHASSHKYVFYFLEDPEHSFNLNFPFSFARITSWKKKTLLPWVSSILTYHSPLQRLLSIRCHPCVQPNRPIDTTQHCAHSWETQVWKKDTISWKPRCKETQRWPELPGNLGDGLKNFQS